MFEILHENLWAWYGLLDDGSFERNKNSVRLVELDGNEKESFVSSYYSPNFIIPTAYMERHKLFWPLQFTADQMIKCFC